MKNVKVKLLGDYKGKLNLDVARLCAITIKTHKLNSIEDFEKIKPFSDKKLNEILAYPHGKLSRFNYFNFIIMGASRRFLQQIVTHKIGATILSGSLQYSNYDGIENEDMWYIPKEIDSDKYLSESYKSMLSIAKKEYDSLAKAVGGDIAGYSMPTAIRNNIILSINLEALRNMGQQRICSLNTSETALIVSKMCELVAEECNLDNKLFMPDCHNCKEKKGRCQDYLGEDNLLDVINKLE